MTTFLAIVVAVLIYPGLLVAGVAAWLFTWMRDAMRGTVSGTPISAPVQLLGEMRAAFARETVTPDGVPTWVAAGLTNVMLLAPLLALALLPLPGNPLASALSWQGDLALEGALLLGVPAARLALAWAIPSVATRLTGDRAARQLAGLAAPMVFALAAVAQLVQSLTADHAPTKAGPNAVMVIALVLGAAAFAGVMPALTRPSAVADEGTDAADVAAGALAEVSGRDFAIARLGEYVQLVAVAAFFVTVFLQPFFRIAAAGAGRGALWILALVLTVLGLGLWEGYRQRDGSARAAQEASVIAWWSGFPLLLSLAAIVATAWALRG